MSVPSLHRTAAFDRALALMESGGPFTFITGRAGTGKSTLLKHFRQTTKLACPVLAPTGVAALNVNGETIHRFFRFAPGISVKDARARGATAKDGSVYRKADLLVIDEISMVRADLLDCMDEFLRAVRKDKRPFGGLRVVVIGDLYQLPPVVSTDERKVFSEMYEAPYFFASHVVQDLLRAHAVEFVELETVYRQTDASFVSLLNAVRNRSIGEKDLEALNLRVSDTLTKKAIVLTAMNDAANALNEERLRALGGTVKKFQANLRGDFPEREAPADSELRLKKGARVMCLANDPDGKYVNGSLGWVKGFGGDKTTDVSVEVDLDDGGTISLSSHTWTVYRSIYDKKQKTLDQEKLGSFVQIPLKLAWAVTIHKSQGKTFDEVAVDLGRGAFAAGQTYVALSRCRSFKGLTLVKPVRLADIRIDFAIVKFVTGLQYMLSKKALPHAEKLRVLKAAAKEKKRLKITYLKGKDEKSERVIVPGAIEEAEYAGKNFLALRAWCELRRGDRTFNVEKIIGIQEL
ncbi:AAA family ATPase [Patescibacteria group bacterium]|nr:AAA family ATPase [Patescibacteria group bacterium]